MTKSKEIENIGNFPNMENMATGTATALKSGNCLHIVLPAYVVRDLKLEDRDEVKGIFMKTGKVIPVRRAYLRKNLNEIPKKEIKEINDTEETI